MEGFAVLKGMGKCECDFDSYDEIFMSLTNRKRTLVFECTAGFSWIIEPWAYRSVDGDLKYASFEIKSRNNDRDKSFNPLDFACFIQDYLLIGFLQVSLITRKNELLREQESFATKDIPLSEMAMPLKVEVTELPIGCTRGEIIFSFQWGFIKKGLIPLRKQTRFNLSSYAMNEMFSDIVFDVKGTNLPAHKIILAAKSPVFEAAFAHEMKEKKNSYFIIDDINPEVFRELLRFFYTDELPTEILKQYGASLLLAADKYDLPRLVDLCTPYAINDETSSEDILHLYMLASSHGSTSTSTLRTNIIKFIKAKGRNFTKSEMFVKFMKDELRTASEIFAQLV